MPNQYSGIYSEDIIDKICDKLDSSYKSVRQCCTECGVSYNAFKNWLNDPTKSYALTQYTRAKEEQKQYMFEELNRLTYRMAQVIEGTYIDPATGLTVTIEAQAINAAVSALRVQIDAIKWQLSKLDPKKYGDKLDVTSDNKPVNVALSVADAKAISDKLNSEV